jgi:lysyl-tRNA synthetase class 2
MSNLSLSQCSLTILKQRAFLLQKIRLYFESQYVLEVETPILSSAGNTDVHIESFTTQAINGEFDKSYLRTSPEFPLKRLLCSGVGDVFEIAKVFRRGEISRTHNIEFTLLEWYRLDFDYLRLIEDVEALFYSLFDAFKVTYEVSQSLTFFQSFQNILAINIEEITLDDLNQVCNEDGYSGSILSKDEALDYLFATQIQPQLDKNCLTFITHYPASQAALSQIDSEDPLYSLRFEVFFQGHELGNGYQELTDGKELLHRFEEDNVERKDNTIRIDENLINAMNVGMPDCSGIAVGIDRLLMVLMGIGDISKVLSFNAENS